MRFDRTQGKEARYLVGVYGWNVQDYYYYHEYREAKAMFEQLKAHKWAKGTALHITDMKRDVRKDYVRV